MWEAQQAAPSWWLVVLKELAAQAVAQACWWPGRPQLRWTDQGLLGPQHELSCCLAFQQRQLWWRAECLALRWQALLQLALR